MKRTVSREHYFTEESLARKCVAIADDRLDLQSYDLIVEPSAGGGAFLELLPAGKRFGLDIEPQEASIIKADFLTWRPPAGARKILTIGNPPFGQRGALAVRFMNHACTFSHAVAFILPQSFNKYTFQNRVNRYFHLDESMDCDADFTNELGEIQSVNTVFQVWTRLDHEREQVVHRTTHPHFEMRHAHLSRVTPEQLAYLREKFEFTIPQVGAQFRPRDVETVTKGSHWFIRPLVPGVRQKFEGLDFSFLDGMNVAHKSLSKKDIILAYDMQNDGGVPPTHEGSALETDQLELW